MNRKNDHHNELTREALRRATDGVTPDIERLVDAVPNMMMEARRRSRRAPADPLAAVVPLARTMLPRVASIAALLLIGCGALLVTGNGSPTEAGWPDLDRLIVTGTVEEGADDPLLDALLYEGDGNG